MAKAAKNRKGNTLKAKRTDADAPAKVSQAIVMDPTVHSSADASQDLPLLPPAIEQWLRKQAAAIGIALFLVAATLAVYGQTLGFGFVSYDDNEYVYENYHVRQGFTLSSVEWAFTGVQSVNWHPLTSLSHILDWSLYGSWAGGHHLTNLLLHAAGSVVLFFALRRLTGATWRSGLVAALFCLHPLHVESVAWVSERKDVLSGLFFGLTLWAYAAYAERRAGSREQGAGSKFPWGSYLLVVALFALGLLCKPMLVTLPFVLLLLDIWPIHRWNSFWPPRSLIVEKLPLLALAAASCAVTYLVQKRHGAITEVAPWGLRLQTALLAYGNYLLKAIVPVNLAASYPPLREPAVLASVVCFLLLAALSAGAAVCAWRGNRHAIVGWLWFLGMIVPVSGIVLIGDQSMADRYTYLPLVGIFVAIAFALPERAGRRISILSLGAMVLLVFGIVSGLQASTWRDSETLWRRVLVVSPENALAHNNLALALRAKGPFWRDEASQHLKEALRIKPEYFLANNNLGLLAGDAGDWEGAIARYRRAIKASPGFAVAYNNLGLALGALGRFAEAEKALGEAVRIVPDFPDALHNLGFTLATNKKWEEAIACDRRAIALEPGNSQTHLHLGIALANLGVAQGNKETVAEGVSECEKGVALSPDDADAHCELAKLYHSLGRIQDAADQWKETLRLNPNHTVAIKGFGILLVKIGRGEEAVKFLRAVTIAAPHDLETRAYLVLAYLLAKQTPNAMTELREVIRQDPHDRRVLAALAMGVTAAPDDMSLREFKAYAYLAFGQSDAAVAEFREILRHAPKDVTALNSLAWIGATHPNAKLRNGQEAVTFAENAAAQKMDDAQTLDTLAAAYAEAGRFKEAVATARKAKLAAEKTKSQPLIDEIAARLKLYEAGKPYRDKTMTK